MLQYGLCIVIGQAFGLRERASCVESPRDLRLGAFFNFVDDFSLGFGEVASPLQELGEIAGAAAAATSDCLAVDVDFLASFNTWLELESARGHDDFSFHFAELDTDLEPAFEPQDRLEACD